MIGSIIPFLLFYMNLIRSHGFNYHLYLYNSQSISLILTAIMNSSITFLIAYKAFQLGSRWIPANSPETILTHHLSAHPPFTQRKKKAASWFAYMYSRAGNLLYKHSKSSANFSWVFIFLIILLISIGTYPHLPCQVMIIFNYSTFSSSLPSLNYPPKF